MGELVLGPHNGVSIKGTRPRRPKGFRKVLEQEQAQNSTSISLNTQFVPPAALISGLPGGGSNWTIDQLPNNHYRITIPNFREIANFLHVLRCVAEGTPYADTVLTDSAKRTHHRIAVLPYIRYHSELYARSIWRPRDLTSWNNFQFLLGHIVDGCVDTFVQCMNHYYPVRPRRLWLEWSSTLSDPTKNLLALSISAYWCRHLFIHHLPAALSNFHESEVLHAIQYKLTLLAQEALSECFDEPAYDHVLSICLLNMTTLLSIEQKAKYHTLAVTMAHDLNIKPRKNKNDDNSDEAELANRLWWYLFQIDYILFESGAISKSLLTPNSDDPEVLGRLLGPMPCSLDDYSENAGALRWSHTLKLWISRMRLVQEVENNTDAMESLYEQVENTMKTWSSELPRELKIDCTTGQDDLDELRLALCLERCTNHGLLLYHFCPPPRETLVLNGLSRHAVFAMISCATEFIRLRGTVVSFAPCQTFPGDLLRMVDVLLYCLEYKDAVVVNQARRGLMAARNLLGNMAEVKWQDDVCLSMVAKVENALSRHEDPVTPAPATTTITNERSSASPTFKLYNGVMMFDKNFSPRPDFYNPSTLDIGDRIIFEDFPPSSSLSE